jgi:tetratricopeptide (TPR) repeat protein
MGSLKLIAGLLLFAVPVCAVPHPKTYRIAGRVLQANEKPFPRVNAVVFLQAALTPFSTHTDAGLDGKFKFKGVRQGAYILVVAVPRVGEVRKTIEVGPGTTDEKGILQLTLLFDRNVSRDREYSVSAAELSVPNNAWQQYQKAQACLQKHDYSGAVALLKKAVEIAPQFALALTQLGTISYHERNYPDAEQYFREALRRDPGAYAPIVNLGGTLLSMGRPDEALSINQLAVRMRPDDALAQVQLGRNYFVMGDMESAEEHLRQGKTLDPAHSSSPQLTLMEIYAGRRDDEGIVRELEEFLTLHPDSKASAVLRRSLEQARRRLAPDLSK